MFTSAAFRRRSRAAYGSLTLPLAALALGLMTLPACDSAADAGDAPGDGRLGDFHANVTGALAGSFEGIAGFAEGTTDGQRVFGVALSTTAAGNGRSIVLIGEGSPAARTYAVAAEDGEASAALIADGTGSAFYYGTAGTLTVTSASGDRLRGRFRVEAADLTDSTKTVTFEGTFDAVRGAVDFDR